jgi:hypothetical protein
MAHYAVADPNREAPQPHAGPRAVSLDALGRRRLETRYIRWVILLRENAGAIRVGLKSSVRHLPRCAER